MTKTYAEKSLLDTALSAMKVRKPKPIKQLLETVQKHHPNANLESVAFNLNALVDVGIVRVTDEGKGELLWREDMRTVRELMAR